MPAELILKNKKFSSLLWTQFFSALNDNYFKNALIMLVTFKGITLGGANIETVVSMAHGIFILPFF